MPREGRKFDRRAIFMAFRYKDMAKGILELNVNGILKQKFRIWLTLLKVSKYDIIKSKGGELSNQYHMIPKQHG